MDIEITNMDNSRSIEENISGAGTPLQNTQGKRKDISGCLLPCGVTEVGVSSDLGREEEETAVVHPRDAGCSTPSSEEGRKETCHHWRRLWGLLGASVSSTEGG